MHMAEVTKREEIPWVTHPKLLPRHGLQQVVWLAQGKDKMVEIFLKSQHFLVRFLNSIQFNNALFHQFLS